MQSSGTRKQKAGCPHFRMLFPGETSKLAPANSAVNLRIVWLSFFVFASDAQVTVSEIVGVLRLGTSGLRHHLLERGTFLRAAGSPSSALARPLPLCGGRESPTCGGSSSRRLPRSPHRRSTDGCCAPTGSGSAATFLFKQNGNRPQLTGSQFSQHGGAVLMLQRCCWRCMLV